MNSENISPFLKNALTKRNRKSKKGLSALEVYQEYYNKQCNRINSIIEEIRSNNELTANLGKADFPIREFATEFGLKISEEFYVDFSGKISSKVITINKSDYEQRKKFSIAHELGHYFMHIENETDERVDEFRYRGLPEYTYEKKLEEEEADNFAGILLMPDNLVKKLYSLLKEKYSQKSSSELVSILTNIFNVSRFAMIVKFRKLNLVSPFEWIDLHG